jgi:TM2 domain-containing membrane protein YozV
MHLRLPAAAACGCDHLLVDYDDPEKRIAELENQLADGMNPSIQQQAAGQQPAGWYPDPGGAALLRYWDGREWTSATDIIPDGDTATPAAEPESFAGPGWSGPPGQQTANLPPVPPQGYPSAPSALGAPYGSDLDVAKPLSNKRAVVAGTLQLLFGIFGVGRFYIGSKAVGACQLGLTILAVVLAVVVPQTADTAVTLIGLLVIAMPIWAFLDAVAMYLRFITDGQGRKLR